MVTSRRPSIEIDLNAAIVAVETRQPLILVVHSSDPRQPDGLPFGPFDPLCPPDIRSRAALMGAEQTALKIGYVEQLYTFVTTVDMSSPATPEPIWYRLVIWR